MALVTADDVQVRLGRDLTVSQRAQVDAWLTDLEALAEARAPGFVARSFNGSPSLEVVRAVFAQAVRRIMLNPEGLRQESRTIDDYTESRTFDSAVSASSVGFTDEEWAQLMPASASAAFSIRPVGAPDDVRGVWSTSTSWRWPV